MLTREQIEQLATFDGGGACVLSVYLDLAPERQVRQSYRAVFKDLVKELREGLDEPAREQLAIEATRIREWLGVEEPQGRGLAIFSCEPRAFWQSHFLPVPVKDHLAFESQPDVAPLLEIVDEYERYAVVLADKRTARLFTVFMGQIEESEAFTDFVPGKHDQGGNAQLRFQRHHETHVLWHLKHVVEHLTELYRQRSFDRLILGGHEEALSQLTRMLPRALTQRLVQRTFRADTSARAAEILEKTLEIEQEIEREFEKRLVAELLELAGAGVGATVGRGPTLDALWAARIQTLVVADGVQVPGSECSTCTRLEPGELAVCPLCGGAMRTVHDLFHRAMERTLEQDGNVEVVHDDAARRLEKAAEGMGAFVRF